MSDIPQVIHELASYTIRAEDNVGTKIVMPLFQALGHPESNRAGQFPVYGYEGRKALPAKEIDYVYCDEKNPEAHRGRTDTAWIEEHSLVLVELKAPSESVEDAEGQAKFYCQWTKCPYYVITNGKELAIYQMQLYFRDEVKLRCQIKDLAKNWSKLQRLLSPKAIQKYRVRNRFNAMHQENTDYSDYLTNLLSDLEQELNFFLSRTLTGQVNKLSALNSPKLTGRLNDEPFYSESYTKLLDSTRSVLVTGDMGAGKTWLLKMLARDIIKKHSPSHPRPVPVILEAKNWRRTYNSIVEGIKEVVSLFVPEITDSIIEDDLRNGDLVILINGLDETPTSDVTTLYTEINKVSQLPKAQIITNCRSDNYDQQLNKKFDSCTIDHLTNDQIRDYITSILGEDREYLFYQLNGELLELVRKPLFLEMLVTYLQSSHEQRLPKNRSELYKYFIKQMIDKWPKRKNLPPLIVSAVIKERILTNYANQTFRNPDSDTALEDVITDEVARSYSTEIVLKELLGSGLLKSELGRIDFAHPSFQEYFFAVSISKLDEEALINFISTTHKDRKYTEVFIFLAGLLREKSKQAILLDYLEAHDLPLFNRCLETRFNLTRQLEEDLPKDFSFKYLCQLKESYERIILSNFKQVTHLCSPWNNKNIGDEEVDFYDLAIKGKIDIDSLRLSYEFDLVRKEDKDTPRVVELPAASTFFFGASGRPEIPLFAPATVTFEGGNRGHYDLRQTNLGIDSAREIALRKVKEDVKTILTVEKVFWGNIEVLACETIENKLNLFSTIATEHPDQFPSNFIGVSLSSTDIDEVIQVLMENAGKIAQLLPTGERKPEYFKPELISLYSMKQDGLNPADFLLPDPDRINPEEIPDRERGYDWGYWSDEQLCARVAKYYDFYQQAYRDIVEKCFPSLKEHLNFYRTGPVKFYVSINKNPEIDEYGCARVKWKPISAEVDSKTIARIGDWVAENLNYDGLYDIAWFDSRFRTRSKNPKEFRILRGHSNLEHYVKGELLLHDAVLERLLDDFKEVIGST